MLKLVSILSFHLIFFLPTMDFIDGYNFHTEKPDHLSLPFIGIRINGGAKYTNSRDISIEIKSLKTDKLSLESMKVGFKADLSETSWIPYSEEKIMLTFKGADGRKTIYAQLMDKAGNISEIESNYVVFDSTAPTKANMKINNNEEYVNDKLGRVLVNLKAEEAHEVFLSNSPYFQNGQWQAYSESVKWVVDISKGDGVKTVYVKFRDNAGNETEPIVTKIKLDTTPPTGGQIQINGGEKFTKSKRLNLTVTSHDATKVRIVSQGVGKNYDFIGNASGKMEILWETDSMEGKKSILAYFMDEAKNTTKTPAEASIVYKTTPPTKALISIDQGAKFSNDPNGLVSVRFSTDEDPKELSMLVSNYPDFKGAREKSFTPAINSWQLDKEIDGLKSIYIRLIDQAKNASEVSKAEIILDRSPPTVHSFNINENSPWCINQQVVLFAEIDDAFEVQFSNNPNALRNAKWENYLHQRLNWNLTSGDGEKTVYARFRDEAGNTSTTTSAKIILDMTPPTGKLIINEGKKATNHPEGLIKIQIQHYKDVMGMQLSNESEFTDVKLLPLSTTVENWKLRGETDEPKTVYMRLKDRAGNYSKVYASEVILDRKPPENCNMIINNGDRFINNRNKKVALSMSAKDANKLIISNEPSFAEAEWVPFNNNISWILRGSEGLHWVYAKFKDEAGNESETIRKSITSDFHPPKTIEVLIDDGAEYSNNPQNQILLAFQVEDAASMAISNRRMDDPSNILELWEPYKTTKSWKVEGGDGLKVIYSIFRDEAGNFTDENYSQITMDRIPPTNGRIAIDNGAKWLTDKKGECNIQLYADGASEFMLSNTANFASGIWEPMNNIRKGWQCNMNQSTARVFAKFRDKAGNISATTSSSINIDTTQPENLSISIDGGARYVTNKNKTFSMELNAKDAVDMRISQSKYFDATSWEPYANSKTIALKDDDGEKTFYVQFRDEAGNISDIISTKIILDTTPPKLHLFIINDGTGWTNDPDKKVELTIDADDAKMMMLSNNPDFTNASWESYSSMVRNYRLTGGDGEKLIFIKLKDEQGNESKPATAKINLKRTF